MNLDPQYCKQQKEKSDDRQRGLRLKTESLEDRQTVPWKIGGLANGTTNLEPHVILTDRDAEIRAFYSILDQAFPFFMLRLVSIRQHFFFCGHKMCNDGL